MKSKLQSTIDLDSVDSMETLASHRSCSRPPDRGIVMFAWYRHVDSGVQK